jgi:hypothetical protein
LFFLSRVSAAKLRSYVFSAALLKKQAGNSPSRLWNAMQAQHFAWLWHEYVHGQFIVLLCSQAISFYPRFRFNQIVAIPDLPLNFFFRHVGADDY